MQLTHLRYVQAIARHGSLSAAARALKVSQPALTGAIKTLEEEYQTTLLLRGRDGITLTEAGSTLLRHAQVILAQVEALEHEIRGIEEDDVGRFVLGCHESLGAYFLPGFMAEFLPSAPRIELTLWNGTSAAVREAVIAREVHLGLSVNPAPHPELVMTRLFEDSVDLFVSADEPVAADESDAAVRVRRGPLVLAGRVQQAQTLVTQLEERGASPARVLSCGDLELVKSLTLAGLGVGVLPRRVAAYNQPGRLRRLHASLPSIDDVIVLLYRDDLHRTRAARRLKDALVRYGRNLGPP